MVSSKPVIFIDSLQNRTLIQLAEAFQKAGGLGLLVGGSVRDYFFGQPFFTDFDLEVYGLSIEQIFIIAAQFGQVTEVGRSFGIFKLRTQSGLSVDISVPRTESKTGNGHRGFEVKTNPFLSIQQALARRDFTINAMAADPLTGELYDYYGGLKDVAAKILRVTDPLRFGEDPLRALRAIQLVGRFGLNIEDESLAILRGMVQQVDQLPAERIFGEWKKLLVQGEFIKLGLQAARKIGFLNFNIKDSDWLAVCKAAERMLIMVRRENLPSSKRLALMVAVLSYGFGAATLLVLESLVILDGRLKKELVRSITEPIYYPSNNIQIRQLAHRLYPATIENMVWLLEAYDKKAESSFLLEKAAVVGVLKKTHNTIISGQNLINLGFKAGPNFSPIIEGANSLHDHKGWSKPEIMRWLGEHDQNQVLEALADLLT